MTFGSGNVGRQYSSQWPDEFSVGPTGKLSGLQGQAYLGEEKLAYQFREYILDRYSDFENFKCEVCRRKLFFRSTSKTLPKFEAKISAHNEKARKRVREYQAETSKR